jgi:hypothetical protein
MRVPCVFQLMHLHQLSVCAPAGAGDVAAARIKKFDLQVPKFPGATPFPNPTMVV